MIKASKTAGYKVVNCCDNMKTHKISGMVIQDKKILSDLHFLSKQLRNDLCCFWHSKVIGTDTEIIIFYIAPVCLGKMFTVNCTLVVHFFYFCGGF